MIIDMHFMVGAAACTCNLAAYDECELKFTAVILSAEQFSGLSSEFRSKKWVEIRTLILGPLLIAVHKVVTRLSWVNNNNKNIKMDNYNTLKGVLSSVNLLIYFWRFYSA